MERVKFCLVLFWALIMAISCVSEPESRTEDTPPPAEVNSNNTVDTPAPVEGTVVENTAFDPGSISQELYDSTKADVQKYIESLNQIIRNKNYNAWKEELSPEFFAEISSPAFLRSVSETDAMKTRNIVLRTAQDYFNNVVVPARANSRVDDIEFIGQHRVMAYTIATNREGQTQRLRLYDLENIGNIWKIVN
jgi:hypothetical protein